MTTPRLALTHDWLTGFGGAERVLKVLAEHWPSAPIFTSVYDPLRFATGFPAERIRTSWLNEFPGAQQRYRQLLPLMPGAFRAFDLRAYDLILASSHAYSKAVKLNDAQVLVCYCYTPIRYLWGELQAEYLAALPPVQALALQALTPALRRADLAAARRVNQFIAISQEVQRRIQRFYGRDSLVIPPPVFTDQWTPVPQPRRDTWLIVSRFVPYKRVEVAVAACAQMGVPLLVVGEGPQERAVRAAAQGADCITFRTRVSDTELRELYAHAKGLLFTAHEDFGLAPLEANACGTPVLAYGAGGALETIVPGVTGEFFAEQTATALAAAMATFEPSRYDPLALRAHAETFSTPVFLQRMEAALADAWSRHTA